MDICRRSGQDCGQLAQESGQDKVERAVACLDSLRIAKRASNVKPVCDQAPGIEEQGELERGHFSHIEAETEWPKLPASATTNYE